MTNREARERLRAVGWVYEGGDYGRGYYGWAGRSRWQASAKKRGQVTHPIFLRLYAPSLADANRRLVEFVETHFGEVK